MDLSGLLLLLLGSISAVAWGNSDQWSDYSKWAPVYEKTMKTSGYYDYDRAASSLLSWGASAPWDHVLEIGCGTGAVMESLLKQKDIGYLAGLDLEATMIAEASAKFNDTPNVHLFVQNIAELSLPTKSFDVIFSNGGVMLFTIEKEGDKEPILISHIQDKAINELAIEALTAHLKPGGILLLNMQSHKTCSNFEKTLDNNVVFKQTATPGPNRLTKEYFVTDGTGKLLVEQKTIFYSINFEEAIELVTKFGLVYEPAEPSGEDETAYQFLRFRKA